MGLWAIVPVKPLRRSKSRLADVMTEEERTTMNFTLLGNTLNTLHQISQIEQTLVISRDPAALALAREYQARTVQEEGSPGLDMAIRRGFQVAQMYSCSSIVVLPADLPLLTVEDIRKFINHTGRPPELIIAPDRHFDGTNALLVNPMGKPVFTMGAGSFDKNIARAKMAGLRIQICGLQALTLDLDAPDDLEYLRKIETYTHKQPDLTDPI
jgi:2-phospho-L-lactate guanylyltransferase